MGRGDTSIGGPAREFPSTLWSEIVRPAGIPENQRRERLEKLIGRYWKPVYAYFRALGRSTVEDAKDLTQEFFLRLMEREAFDDLDPGRGSFRGFLKRSARNFRIDQARREGARRPADGKRLFRLDEIRDEAEPPDGNGSPDGVFDREWKNAVMRASLDRLREKLEAGGRSREFEILSAYCLPAANPEESSRFLHGGLPAKTYQEVAQRLGLRHADVRKSLERSRSELRAIVREEIGETVSRESDIDDEFREMIGG